MFGIVNKTLFISNLTCTHLYTFTHRADSYKKKKKGLANHAEGIEKKNAMTT